VVRLPERISEYSLTKLRLPVVFGEAARIAISSADEGEFDAVLCIGQAGGRSAITPELVGINLRHATIPDNNGNQPSDETIIEGGSAAYFSTLPVREMTEAIKAVGLPSSVSYSAGAYVCNDLLYSLLSHFDQSETKVAFIHIPYSSDQGKQPSMDLDDIVKGLTVAIECI
jgi:pyroglutamyl-peptidase